MKASIGIMCMGCNDRLSEQWDTLYGDSKSVERRLDERAKGRGWVKLPPRALRPHPVDMCGECVREIAALKASARHENRHCGEHCVSDPVDAGGD